MIVRSLLVAFALLVSPAALAAEGETHEAAAVDTAGALTQTTAAASSSSGMHPGVAPPAKSKHPYFFAAYAAVWGGLFLYALWLGSRISSLEQKVTSVTDRSR